MRIKRFESFSTKKFVWIHGLPGSGKTYLANQMNKNNDYTILDDIIDMSKVQAEMDKGNNIILSSPYFEKYIGMPLESRLRKTLEGSDYQLEEIWFENNPQNCIKNINNRVDHNIKANILAPEVIELAYRYRIPEGSKVIPVWTK